jgi:DNA-binding HxlR family transcriptional regulator
VPGRPPHTEYVLTARGKRLAGLVAGLLDAGQR